VNTVAIMQPTYLPWAGYFDMIDQADTFVLLDTVAIDRKSWQTRNRILGRDGNVVWLSVPVTGRRIQRLDWVVIANDQNWRRKHLRTLESAYGHLSHPDAFETVLNLIQEPWAKLTNLTSEIILSLASTLGIETPIVRASDYGLPMTVDPLRRVRDLCEATNADELLNASGARHLYPDDFPVPIRWHQYEPAPYEQNGGEFISHLSVIDALARLGPESTLDLVRSGRMSSERV
jgi:hypothetical protein